MTTAMYLPSAAGGVPMMKLTLPSGTAVRPDEDGHMLVDSDADIAHLKSAGWRVLGKSVPAASVGQQRPLIEVLGDLRKVIDDADVFQDELEKGFLSGRRDLNELKGFNPFACGSQISRLTQELRNGLAAKLEQAAVGPSINLRTIEKAEDAGARTGATDESGDDGLDRLASIASFLANKSR